MKQILISSLILLLAACSNQKQCTVVNELDTSSYKKAPYSETAEKVFELDSCSAPRPVYMGIQDINGRRVLTFLNEYNYSIYGYDYDSNKQSFVYALPTGGEEIIRPKAYVFMQDSVCGVLDVSLMKLLICDFKESSIVSQFDLRGDNNPQWPDYYPQYLPTSSNPLIYSNGKIELIGQAFKSLTESNLGAFHIETTIDPNNHDVNYETEYPSEYYGNGVNWEGGYYTSVYKAILPDGTKLYSFPMSHNILVKKNGNSKWKYGGSPIAHEISSIPVEISKTTEQDIFSSSIGQDSYGPILYDPFNKRVYRFISYRVDDTAQHLSLSQKIIGIIVMDENLNYLGEAELGNGYNWNINNAFITKEGLNIEYNGNQDEDHLVFKILKFN